MGKKSKPPPPPDYTALAHQQAALDKQAAIEKTTADRPTQITPWGTTTWDKDDQGNWTERVTLSPEEQQALDTKRQFELKQQQIGGGLLDKAGVALEKPMNFEGLPELRGLDLSSLPAMPDAGFGAVEQVRDAMMSRMAPQREQSRSSELQRLKNQGLSENSEAFQRAMTRLDQGDTDATQQALLGAMDAYGDIYNRGMAGRQQMATEQERAANLAAQLRQQGISEREMERQSPINDYMKLVQGVNPTMPDMPNFMASQGYNAANVYGAGKDSYQAKMDQFNAKQAKQGGITSGLFGLAGSVMGGPIGGMIGSKIGGMMG